MTESNALSTLIKLLSTILNLFADTFFPYRYRICSINRPGRLLLFEAGRLLNFHHF